jgi:hypothetical protein
MANEYDDLKEALTDVTDEYMVLVDKLQAAYRAVVETSPAQRQRINLAAVEAARCLSDLHEVEMAYQAALVALTRLVEDHRSRDLPPALSLHIEILASDRLVRVDVAPPQAPTA